MAYFRRGTPNLWDDLLDPVDQGTADQTPPANAPIELLDQVGHATADQTPPVDMPIVDRGAATATLQQPVGAHDASSEPSITLWKTERKASIGGEVFSLTEEQHAFLRQIAKSPRVFTSSAKLKSKSSSPRFDRMWKRMPKELREHMEVRAGRGGGFRLTCHVDWRE